MANEEIMEKMMSDEELALVAGGNRWETDEIIKFYRSKGFKWPDDFNTAAVRACQQLHKDFNLSVSLNTQATYADETLNRYRAWNWKDRHKKYSHAEIMDMLRKKYGN